MNRYGTFASLLAFALGAVASDIALAQSPYPAKPVTLIVAFSPGGSTDLVTRIIAKELSGQFDKQVIVDNRAGGGGVIGWNSVARSPADGYTVLATELSFAIAAGLFPNLPFDPRKDFQQVVTAISVPHALVVTPSLPVKSVKEFLALAKARPGELNYGSGGNGTNTHLGSELLKNLTGIKMVHIPYKGAGAVLQDLMGGQVQVLISAIPTILPYVKAGRLRALMVTDDQRARVLPDVPSANEVGLPKMVMKFWVGYAVPAGTPQPVVERLNQAMLASLNTPDARKRFAELGLDPVGNTPAQATKLVADEMDRWTAVVKAAGIKAE
ncbi:MAG TPA: tripartite tricarboxylate transporter substrate binding protein [Burkholderiales bacterium]|nr:tripartite tricarboxylate transporter substrate binding protein [Burkholderiales bacterium]